MIDILNIPPEDQLWWKRLLLVAAVILAFLTLAFCHLQPSNTDTITQDLTAKSALTPSDTSLANGDDDADGDGLANALDACPDTAGAAIDNGCPVDSDGDGFADMEDKCPTRSGDIDGCPKDIDNDGITDREDKCPNVAGPVASQGCPSDNDGDGVSDAIDQCPQTAGQVSLNGCLPGLEPGDVSRDTGNTSETRSASVLPDNTGTRGAQPDVTTAKPEPADSDDDGIADIDDRCPTIAGTADTEGCAVTDSGGGTRLDALDLRILDAAVAGVAFDSNSATLTSESSELLTDVADLLRKYPTATLEIRGHTDASGVADNNMQLSMARARSAAAYIVSVGIDVSRLRAFGYGESQPIADNKNPAGRRTNRRVEFELLFND